MGGQHTFFDGDFFANIATGCERVRDATESGAPASAKPFAPCASSMDAATIAVRYSIADGVVSRCFT